MYVQVSRRSPDAPRGILGSLLIQGKVMKGYGGKAARKRVVSVRRSSSLWGVLEVICIYAAVDKIALLPILIIVNTLAFLNTLHTFGLLM